MHAYYLVRVLIAIISQSHNFLAKISLHYVTFPAQQRHRKERQKIKQCGKLGGRQRASCEAATD